MVQTKTLWFVSVNILCGNCSGTALLKISRDVLTV